LQGKHEETHEKLSSLLPSFDLHCVTAWVERDSVSTVQGGKMKASRLNPQLIWYFSMMEV
jgi:hypothetical protein